MTFGERVRALREKHGWSKAELARRAGIKSPYSLIRLERGEYLPTLEAAQRLADVLGDSSLLRLRKS